MLLRPPRTLVFRALLPLAAPSLMHRALLVAAPGLLSMPSPGRPRRGRCSLRALVQSTLPALVQRALLLTAQGRLSVLTSRRPSGTERRLRAAGLCSTGLLRGCQCSGCPCIRARCPCSRLLPAMLLQAC